MIVGQKVICVDDQFDPFVAQFYIALPKKDVMYVIRNVEVGISPEGQAGEICVLLIGVHNPRSSKAPFRERGFKAERFRPLDECKEKARQGEPEKVAAGAASDFSNDVKYRSP